MEKTRGVLSAAVAAVWVQAFLGAALAQGPLVPPAGPPAPVMKSLAQIEPRTPITNLPFTISAPGAYYLTTNFTVGGGFDGITITTSDVDLDLGGFVLSGAAGGNNGIASVGSLLNVRVHNGTVRNWGLAGVNLGIQNGQIENIRAAANGGSGIQCGPGSTIINCAAGLNAGIGIYASANCLVKNCATMGNYSYGIQALTGSSVLDCVAGANTNGGIYAGGAGCTISRCTARQNGGSGFIASPGATVADNTAYLNSGHGIFAFSSSTIARNQCETNGAGAGTGAGVYCSGSNNRIENNHLTGNDTGIQLDAAKNYVAGNTVQNNADNYAFAAGNELNLLIGQIPESIDWPAKAELTGSMTAGGSNMHGIVINADNVTLDLKGHTLTGTPGASNGIFAAFSRQNITVMNGTVAQWQFGLALGASNCTASGVNAAGNTSHGIYVGNRSRLLNCVASRSGVTGITAGDGCLLQNCTSEGSGFNGFEISYECVLDRCRAVGNTNWGIAAQFYTTLESCQADRNGSGMSSWAGSIRNCSANGNNFVGISSGLGGRIEGCKASYNGFAGISSGDSDLHIEGNYLNRNLTGISLSHTNCFVVRNDVSGSTSGTNYNIVAGNKVGPITNTPATATSPWANFSY